MRRLEGGTRRECPAEEKRGRSPGPSHPRFTRLDSSSLLLVAAVALRRALALLLVAGLAEGVGLVLVEALDLPRGGRVAGLAAELAMRLVGEGHLAGLRVERDRLGRRGGRGGGDEDGGGEERGD